MRYPNQVKSVDDRLGRHGLQLTVFCKRVPLRWFARALARLNGFGFKKRILSKHRCRQTSTSVTCPSGNCFVSSFVLEMDGVDGSSHKTRPPPPRLKVVYVHIFSLGMNQNAHTRLILQRNITPVNNIFSNPKLTHFISFVLNVDVR